MCLFFNFEKRVWPHWPATPISYRAKTDKWILLLSGSNFPFLLVDKRNREFFPEKFSQGVEMSFFKIVNPNVHRWRHIAFRKKMIWPLLDKFSRKNFLFRLSTHKKRKFYMTKLDGRIIVLMIEPGVWSIRTTGSPLSILSFNNWGCSNQFKWFNVWHFKCLWKPMINNDGIAHLWEYKMLVV